MRFSILIKDEMYQELQRIRGERIQNTGKSVSLGELIRELLRAGMEALKK